METSTDDNIFGDFVDFTSSNKTLKSNIDNNLNLLIENLNIDIDLIQKDIEEPMYDSKIETIFDLKHIDSKRCYIIYEQLFNSALYNHQNKTNDLDSILLNSHTYSHLINILTPYIKSENVKLQNHSHSGLGKNDHEMLAITHINNFTDKIITIINQLGISPIDETEFETYFQDLKNNYLNCVIKNNNHLSVLTDHDVLALTLDLIKQKMKTQNLSRDNEVYKNVVRNFIEQSQKKRINKLKKDLKK